MRAFVETCDAVAATTKKLEKIRLVSQLLRSLPLEDAVRAAIFLTGRAFPRNDERILGVGGTQLYRLVAELAGKDAGQLGEVTVNTVTSVPSPGNSFRRPTPVAIFP